MHFIRKINHDHVLEMQYYSTDDQVADIFTKALTEAKFTKLRFMVGVQEVVTKGGQALMPPSPIVSYLYILQSYPKFFFRGGCQDIPTHKKQLSITWRSVELGKVCFFTMYFCNLQSESHDMFQTWSGLTVHSLVGISDT